MEALASADVFFASLLFDYDQVAWLNPRLERVPTRFVFESALELMSATRVGSFAMAGGGGGQTANYTNGQGPGRIFTNGGCTYNNCANMGTNGNGGANGVTNGPGSGGGGFLLLYAPEKNQKKIRTALKEFTYTPFKFESEGSRIINY